MINRNFNARCPFSSASFPRIGLTRNPVFNYTSISREIGVAANTVRGYFEVLVDTLIAAWVPAWTKRAKRRVIGAPRFYFFDVGIVNDLARRRTMVPGSAEFGAAFEHFIWMELRAHAGYRGGCLFRTGVRPRESKSTLFSGTGK
jgi:predicted AAA+ superfamily ATPase